MKDRLTAHALSLSSAAAQFAPPLRDKVTGFDSPNYTPVRWRFNGMSVGEVHNWIEIPGNPQHGRVPSKYGEVALLAARTHDLDTYRKYDIPVRPAVAYALGEAVMVGIFPANHDFSHDDTKSMVGMRIGQGVLQASMGVWDSTLREYRPTRSVPELLDRVPVYQVPADIPVV